MFNEPWTKEDWVHQLKRLVDEDYPDAVAILLVMDNLNSRKRGSLQSTFAPEEAFRIASSTELYDTPKHGTWRNMAEFERSA